MPTASRRLPQDLDVIELRRYTMVPGERERFGRLYDAYFPESFQQLGAIIFGQFFERDDATRFTWIRGFRDVESRRTVNEAFYQGPVWREHGPAANARMVDHTNVLLLQPMAQGRGIPILRAVDVIGEPDGAQGIAVAHIFAVRTEGLERFADAADREFASYRAVAGVREAGALVSLDVPNNFPMLPFRTDIPFFVWLGVVADEDALARLRPHAERAAGTLGALDLYRAPPELVVLQPTPRSRLRWLPEWRS